jgi:hypothetical protein
LTHIVAQMNAHVRTAAAALITVGVLAGCSQTTTGTVAMTTEPGPTTMRSSKPTPTPDSPTSSPRPSTPGGPAPDDALTMTCKEYSGLDEDTQQAVIDEILGQEGSVLGPENAELAKTLADATCGFLPDAVLSEILFGGPPP